MTPGEGYDGRVPGAGWIDLDAAGGGRLRYEIVGDGVPLLVLHGGPGLGRAYLRDPLLRALGVIPDRHGKHRPSRPTRAGSWQVIAFDQRGSGESTGDGDPSQLTMDRLVADVDHVRRYFELDGVNLLGHSFGGLLAMRYAIAHPGRVRSLVLVDPDPACWQQWTAFRDEIERRLTDDDRQELAGIRAVPGWRNDPRAMQAYLRTVFRTYCFDRTAADDLDLGLDRESLARLHRTGELVRASLGRYDIRNDLGRIACPSLIIAGAASIFPPAAARVLRERIRDSTLVVLERAGHFPYAEDPAGFREAFAEFLPGAST